MIIQSTGRIAATTAALAGLLIASHADTALAGTGPSTPAQCGWGIVRDVSGVAKFFIDSNKDGSAESAFAFGATADDFLIGDWGGDGIDNVAVRKDIGGNGKFFFNNTNVANTGGSDNSFILGPVTADALVGDWNGDGTDNVAVRRDIGGVGKFFFDTNGDRVPEVDYVFGAAVDVPVVGNWDGNTTDNIGIVRDISGGLRWFLAGDNGSVASNFAFGQAGDIPIVGDWNNDGSDNVGVVRNVGGILKYFLDTNGDSTPEIIFAFGSQSTDTPVACRFSGVDMKDEVGIARAEGGGALRFITTSALDGAQTLRVRFGNAADSPFVGVFESGS